MGRRMHIGFWWDMHDMQGKKPLGRTKCMWEDNIIMGFTEIGWGGVEWIDLA
jgi:hypothetical protein